MVVPAFAPLVAAAMLFLLSTETAGSSHRVFHKFFFLMEIAGRPFAVCCVAAMFCSKIARHEIVKFMFLQYFQAKNSSSNLRPRHLHFFMERFRDSSERAHASAISTFDVIFHSIMLVRYHFGARTPSTTNGDEMLPCSARRTPRVLLPTMFLLMLLLLTLLMLLCITFHAELLAFQSISCTHVVIFLADFDVVVLVPHHHLYDGDVF